MLLVPAWRRAAALAGLVLTIAAVSAAPASADPIKTMTVDAEVVYRDGQAPNDPGNCSAIVFVQWAHVENATAWKVVWTELGKETSRVVSPPFDDTYEWVATYTVPAGFHWIEVGKSWADGPGTRDCKDMTAKHRDMYGTDARVQVTVDNTGECNAAKAAHAKAGKAVRRARKRRAAAALTKALRAQRAATREKQRLC